MIVNSLHKVQLAGSMLLLCYMLYLLYYYIYYSYIHRIVLCRFNAHYLVTVAEEEIHKY